MFNLLSVQGFHFLQERHFLPIEEKGKPLAFTFMPLAFNIFF